MGHPYFNLSQEEVVSPAAPAAQSVEYPSPDPADQKFVYSLFNSEKDNVPKQQSKTWKQLCDTAFRKHLLRSQKNGGPGWSPVSYKSGEKRGIDGVQEIHCAVFDIDHHVGFETIKPKLSGYAFIAHSSFSHTKDDPRYRIVIPLLKPVMANDWPPTWAQLNQWIGGFNDPATKDASRLYFLPSHPAGAEGHFIDIGEGKPLDVADLPKLPPAVKAQIQSINSHGNVKIEGIEDIPRELSPEPGLHEVCNRCAFMRQVSQPENQNAVSEPLWKAMISNAACFENADEWIHEASCHHDGYSKTVTDKSIKRFRDGSFGPMTCQRIQDLGFKDCPAGGCKTPTGKVTKAPAGLGSWAMKQLPSNQVNKPGTIESFLVMHFPSGLYYCNESFYGYIAGAWVAQDERSDIRRKIAELMGSNAKGKKVNDTLTLLKDFQSVREADINKNKHLICLQNGTLDTNSYELLEHSPSHGLMTKTNIEWNPDATCPRWLRFLDEIFVNDIDKDQKIAFVKEWFGYCLAPDSSLHKFVMMVGAGGNGKSVLLFILVQLVGVANVSHAHIERLDEKYVRAELEGKLVNISSEMSADATIADGYLKAIVAGDIVEAERKYKPSFSFRPYSRLIGSTNGLPRLLDHSEGFARRAIILTFNRIFALHEQDTALEQALLNELSGILSWAVDGLRQLRERKTFDIPQSSIAALAQYRRDSDPVQQFAEECLEPADGCGITPAEIYWHYQDWNRLNGFAAMNKVRFGKRLAEILGDGNKHRSGGKDYWRVRIKPDNDYFPQVPLVHSPELSMSNACPTRSETVQDLIGKCV